MSFRSFAILCLVVVAPLFAGDAGPSPYPSSEDSSAWPGQGPIRLFEWMPKNREQFWAERANAQGAVVFAGDSLTAGWSQLTPSFPGLKIANRGIGGDTSHGLLFRFREDVLDLHPRAIVVCIGTNDLSAHAAPADTAANVVELIRLARAQDPQLPIVLCTIPPRDNPEYPTSPGAHEDLNTRIRALGDADEHVVVLDLFRGLATPEGKPVPEYFARDRIHLAAPGYSRWSELLRPILEQWPDSGKTSASTTADHQRIKMTVTQADGAWLPEGTNLRWSGGRLESLFFVLVTSSEEQTSLKLRVVGGDGTRTEAVADIHPISEAEAAAILASDPTWFSMKGDLQAQKTAATRSLCRIWVPVTTAQPIAFELRRGDETLASQKISPTWPGPLWYQFGWDAAAEDPVLHGRVLFPHNSLMVRRGGAVALTLDLVGSGTVPAFTATLTISVRPASSDRALWRRHDIFGATAQSLTQAKVALPANEWAPGDYVVTAELQDEAGKFIGTIKRGLVIVDSTPVASRFGATYANLTTPPSVYADPAEEPDIFKRAREYHATHMGPDTDIVVSFEGRRDHLIFSHLNRGYTPFWFVNELGINWEWVEGHDDELGSLEVQYDPECRYARASIVASTPARAVVHWRYNTASRYYDRYFDEWVDEFYYIYPDQTAVRKIMGYFRRHNWHETFEPYLVGPAGLHLSDVFEDRHLSFLNLVGGRIDLDPINMWKGWHEAWKTFHGGPKPHPALLAFNLRGGRKFFYAFADLRRVYSLWSQVWGNGNTVQEVPGGREQPFPQDTETPSAKLLQSQISSYCLFDAHAALLEARSLPDRTKFTPAQLERETENPMSQTKDKADVRVESTWAFLLGLGDQVDPIGVTRAWVESAKIDAVSGLEFVGYAAAERAYRFHTTTGDGTARFRFTPAKGSPQINPVFLIEGLVTPSPVAVRLAGQRLPDNSISQGFEAQPNGTYRAVIWMRRVLTEPTDVVISQP